MSSRLRTSSLTPNKDRKQQLNKLFYPVPNDKQFIAYSWVQKESSLLGSNHERLLLFDSIHKSLRYYSKIPNPLPVPTADIPEGKEMVFIKKVRGFEFRSARTSIGKAVVKWSDLNGEKKSWQLTFPNNYLMNDWVIMVNEAIKDGHLQAHNRPQSTSRRTTKSNINKYMTPFMAETGGYQRDSSASRGNVWGDTSSESKNNQDWLAGKLEEKEKQMVQVHSQIHNIDRVWQRDMVSPKEEDKGRGRKIGMIREDEDESKLSKREDQDMHTDSAREFRIDRQLPEIVREEDQGPGVDSRVGGARQADYMKEVGPGMNSGGRNEHMQIRRDEDTSEYRYSQQPALRADKAQEMQIDRDQQASRNRETLQFLNKISKARQPALMPITSTPQPQPIWFSPQSYTPFGYSQFLQLSEQLSMVLVDNLPQIIKQATCRSTSALHIDSQENLLLCKHNIQLKFSLSAQARLDPFSSQGRVQSLSSMFEYIRRLSQKSPPPGYARVVCLPYCVVAYKCHHVECSAVVPGHAVELSPQAGSRSVSGFFDVPDSLWRYYSADQPQGPTLYIDCATTNNTRAESIDQQTLTKISTAICTEQVPICHIGDLSQYCEYSHSVCVDQPLVISLLSAVSALKELPFRSLHMRTLLSMLYGIRMFYIIAAQVHKQVLVLQAGQLLQMVDWMIKAMVIDRHGIYGQQVTQEVQHRLRGINVGVDDIDQHCTFATVLTLLGIELAKAGGRDVHTLRFAPFCHVLTPGCLSQEMAQLEDILAGSDGLRVDHYREEAYQRVKQLLGTFEALWLHAKQSAGEKSGHYGSTTMGRSAGHPTYFQLETRLKYLSQQPRLSHYLSLYQSPEATPAALLQSPPLFYSYLQGINSIKWACKHSPADPSLIAHKLQEQIRQCRQWSGTESIPLLLYYELYAVWAEQMYDFESAVAYARQALQVVVGRYGHWAPHTAERWYLLGNVMMDGQQWQQALEAYAKALQVIECTNEEAMGTHSTPTSIGTSRMLKNQLDLQHASLLIRNKMCRANLAMGQVEQCLALCCQCHEQLSHSPSSDSALELQTLGLIIRCYQLLHHEDKLIQLIEIVSAQFGNAVVTEPLLPLTVGTHGPTRQQSNRETMLRMCTSVYLRCRIRDASRRAFILGLVRAIRAQHQNRHTPHEYSMFLTRTTQARLPTNSAFSILQHMADLLATLPVLMPAGRGGPRFGEGDLHYGLYDSAARVRPVTQPKVIVAAMRMLEGMSGVLGWGYIEGCFQ